MPKPDSSAGQTSATGTPGLDQVLAGGFTPNRIYLIEGDPGPPAIVRPRTGLLREGLDVTPQRPYFLFEEEVPRAGARVTHSWQRTRWYGGSVVLWMRVTGANGQTLHHVWFHGDDQVGDVALNVAGSPWRTWSRKTIPAEATGAWHVEIRDAAGTVLKRIDFTVGR